MIKNISNLGDAAIYCDFGSEVNKEINHEVIKYFKTLTSKNIKGITNLAPSYNKLIITFDLDVINYKELVETLTEVLISLNKNIKEIKSLQAISNISAQYFSNGVFSDRNGIPIVKLIDIEGDWENLTGYKKEEILEMDNIIGKIMEVENVQEYLSRFHPIGLSEASYKGFWIFKHKNGNKFKISGKTWIDYNENTFKSAFSVA